MGIFAEHTSRGRVCGDMVSWERLCPARTFPRRFTSGRCGRDTSVPKDAPARGVLGENPHRAHAFIQASLPPRDLEDTEEILP